MPASPVIEIYIKNYSWNGSTVTAENLIQTVPIEGTPVITNPKVKCEMGKAGSFEFGMEANSPYYNSLLQMNTLMRVTYFGNTIFRGRVLTIDKTMTGSRTVHCEGDLAFLMDTYQPGTKEDARPKIGVLAYLQQIINQHNSEMANNSYKRFTLGEVPGQYTSATPTSQRVVIPTDKATQAFGDTGWNTTMDRLEGLLGDFGGFFHTRHDVSTGVTYLDWHDNYYNATTNPQSIEIRKNLIDISGSTEIDNIFTYVVPIGQKDSGDVFIGDYWPVAKPGHTKDNFIMVPELASIPLYTDAELNSGYHHKADYQNAITKFGRIWKVVNFDNADTPEKLFAYAKDWIKNNYMPEITQWDVTALDLKIVDPTQRCLLCGDRILVAHQEVDSSNNIITIIMSDLDLYNPDKNKYTIGIPNQQINASYGVKNKTNKSKGSGGTISGGGPGKPEPKDPPKDIEAIRNKLDGLYFDKTEWGVDITLDDPRAFLLYDTDGNERPKKEVTQETFKAFDAMAITKNTKRNQLLQEAIQRGVSIDDPQLVIDFTPTLKTKQDNWKQSAELKWTSQYGLTPQEANVLLNETAGQSWLASLVDDDGNWTQTAIDRGIPSRAGAAKIKQQATDTRNILNGTKRPTNTDLITGFRNTVTGGNFDFGGGSATFDINNVLGELNFDIKDIFNLHEVIDGVTEAFLGADTGQVDLTSGQGKIGVGQKTNNKWPITVNHPITYTDSSGQTHTMVNSIHALDYHLDEIGSVKADLLAVEVLLADYAEIGTLVALEGRVDTIEATKITADDITATLLKTKISTIDTLLAQDISASGLVYAGSYVKGSTGIYYSGADIPIHDGVWDVQVVDNHDGTYTLQKYQFNGSGWVDVGTFSKAISSSSWSWSGGMAVVTLQPQNQTFRSKAIDTINYGGSASWASDKKSFTIRLDVDDVDGTTVFSDDVFFNTSTSYNEGHSVGYSAGTTAGYNSAHLSGSWGTGSDSNRFTVTKVNTGSSDSLTCVVTAGISYDSLTHKYTAMAYGNQSSKATAVSGTEAWDAVKVSTISAPVQSSSQTATLTATASNGETKTRDVAVTNSGFSGGGTNAQIRLDSTSGSVIAQQWIELPSSATWTHTWVSSTLYVYCTVGGKQYSTIINT